MTLDEGEKPTMYDWSTIIPDGCVWNEVQLESGHPLNRVLLSLLVIRDDQRDNLQVELVGTAFIIQTDSTSAFAVSAAHCFERIREIIHPNPLHHTSALPEFLPPLTELDLKNVKALYYDGNISVPCNIELATWDRDTDYALLFVNSPSNQPLFKEWLRLDDQIPQVGDHVCMIGLGEMEFVPNIDPVNFGTLKRRVVLRVGREENIHLEGYYVVKSPCVETSISAFPGMSGGIVARWTYPHSPQIEPFGFISRSMSQFDYMDRSISGRSIGAILKMERTVIADGVQTVRIRIKAEGVGRDSLSFTRSYDQQHGSVSMDNTLASPLSLELCLLCDDVRQEDNLKKILIGVYNDLVTPPLPTSTPLCLWMRFKAPPVGEHVIEFSVVGERNQKLIPNQSVNVNITDQIAYFEHILRVMLHLTEPGVVRFQWRDNGGDWEEALSLKVSVKATPVTMIAEPPT